MYMGRHVGFSACNTSKLQQQLSEDRSGFNCALGLAVHGLGNKPQLGCFLAPGIRDCPREGNATARQRGMLRYCQGFSRPGPDQDIFSMAGKQTCPGHG